MLDGIEPVDQEAGLEMVGMLAGEREPGLFVGGYSGFPPEPATPDTAEALPRLKELEGYVVRPQPGANLDSYATTGTQLYIGLEATKGRAKVSFERVRILYHAGDERHALTTPYSVSLCTPREDYVPRKKPCGGTLPGETEPGIE